MFRTSSRQPVQVVAPAPPIVMSSQPIYIPAPKASSSGMNQPYTILVGSHGSSRRPPIEIVVGSSSSSSSRRDDHPVQPTRDRRHSTTHYPSSSSHGHSYEQPKIIISSSPSSSSKHHHRSTSATSAPRSDVATYGGSVYGDARSKGYSSSHDSHGGHHRDDQHYHSHGHSDSKRESATSRRNSIAVPQQTSSRHRTYSGSGDYLRPPTTTQPVKIPSSSPQKHTRFAALPQSVPTKPVALPPVNNHHSAPIQVASSYPITNARPHGHHRSSHSHDLTLYATRPRQSPPLGWFNRRGDQYFVESGLVRKADGSTKWNAVFNDYPEPGTGWMDHEKRFIPASGGILKH